MNNERSSENEDFLRDFGSIPLSPRILDMDNVGLWGIEIDDGKEPRMYADATMLRLVGADKSMSPEEVYHCWYDHIDKNHYDEVASTVEKMILGERAEVQYPWHYPNGKVITVRSGGIRNFKYSKGIRLEGTHQDVSQIIHFQKEQDIKEAEMERIRILDVLFSEYLILFKLNLDTSEGELVYCSSPDDPRLELIKGVPTKLAIERYVKEFVVKEDREKVLSAFRREEIRKTLVNKKKSSIRYREKIASGYRYIEVNFVKEENVDQRSVNVAIGFVDIDKQYRNEIEQQEQRAIISDLSEQYEYVCYVDALQNNVFTYYASPYFQKIIGQCPNNISTNLKFDMFINKILYKGDRDEFITAVERKKAVSTIDKSSFLLHDFRAVIDGNILFYRLKMTKDPYSKNGFVLGLYNINDEKNQQAVIDGLSQDFETVVCFDPETKEETQYRVGTTQIHDEEEWRKIDNFDDRINFLIEKLVHPDDKEKFREAANTENLLKELSKNKVYYATFRSLVDGESMYWQLKCVLAGTNIIRVVAGFRNVDEEMRKELAWQKDLETALSAAKEANKAKTRFLFNMSHDIRTPLNAISGYTTMAKTHVNNPERIEDYLSKIELASNSLIDLVNQVLEMARIESGKVEIQEKEANIEEQAQAMLTIAVANANVKGIRVSLEFGRIRNWRVTTDVGRINQILTNILGNAVKYTLEGGNITFKIEQLDYEAEDYGLYSFVIEDTGIGMNPDFLEHIFEVFARERDTTTSGIQGTGLGMAIVNRLVDVMNGKINIESALGKGTKVEIQIPMKICKSSETVENTKIDSKDFDFSGKRILLVEDNEMNREIACEILQANGFEVETSEDGDFAVEMVETSAPGYFDFVLMDIQMPRMNGYEATRAIRALDNRELSSIPIIAMTANAFEEDRRDALAAGMNEHIPKPIEIKKLLSTLASFVKKEFTSETGNDYG